MLTALLIVLLVLAFGGGAFVYHPLFALVFVILLVAIALSWRGRRVP